MSALAKAALLITGLAAIGGGGGYYLWKTINDIIPHWHSLSDDKNFSESSSGYTGKYGATYGNYLLGVAEGKEGVDPESKNNDLLWDWIYLNRFLKEEQHQGKFKKVKQAINGDSANNLSLKNACAQAYKEKNGSDGKIKTTGQTGDDDFQEEDIWKFCSPIGQKPTTLNDSKNSKEKETYSGKWGGESSTLTKFISIDDPNNAIFWDIRQEEFFKGSGKFSPPSENAENFFKTFYDTEKSKEKDQRKTIKERCKEAYLTNKVTPVSENLQTTTSPTSTEITKYCSLDGSS